MKNYSESEPSFVIELPKKGDEHALAPMHIQSWKESYVGTESGLTEEKVDEMLAHMLEDASFRKNTINEALTNPDKLLYRVVKNARGNIVGFLHGTKHENYNELDAIYLLNEAKGTGIGGKLMEEFLSWADEEKDCLLKVLSFNDSALGFYTKYGFVKTDTEIEPYKKVLPVVEMIRSPDAANLIQV